MKTNTMLHRYLALFLGIVMLWSMLPLSVSAAKESNSSSDGGSSTHTSSSGATHGGGGG